MTTNRYGVDTSYMKKELKAIISNLDNYTASEFGAALTRLADVNRHSVQSALKERAQRIKEISDYDFNRGINLSVNVVLVGYVV